VDATAQSYAITVTSKHELDGPDRNQTLGDGLADEREATTGRLDRVGGPPNAFNEPAAAPDNHHRAGRRHSLTQNGTVAATTISPTSNTVDATAQSYAITVTSNNRAGRPGSNQTWATVLAGERKQTTER